MSIRSILSFFIFEGNSPWSIFKATRWPFFSRHAFPSWANHGFLSKIPRWSSTSLKIRTANVESPASTILHRICHLSLCFFPGFPVFFSHRDAGSCAAELVAHVGPALPRLHHHGLPPVLGEGWDPWGPKTSTGVKTPGDTRRVKSRPNNNSCGPRNRCFTMFYWSCDELVTASFHGFFWPQMLVIASGSTKASLRAPREDQVGPPGDKVDSQSVQFIFLLPPSKFPIYAYIYIIYICNYTYVNRMYRILYIYTYVTHWLIIEIANSQKKMIVICDPLGLRQASNEETSTRGSVVDPADSAFDHDSLQTICM